MLNAGRVSRLSDLPPLHTTVLSFDGQLVDTIQEVWRFRSSLDGGKTITLHWERQDEPSILSPRVTGRSTGRIDMSTSRATARTINPCLRITPESSRAGWFSTAAHPATWV